MIIPLPKEIQLSGDSFLLPHRLNFENGNDFPELDNAILDIMDYVKSWLRNGKRPVSPYANSSTPNETFATQVSDTSELPIRLYPFAKIAASHKDMHLIQIEASGITISAKNTDGFRYALQSLKQLLYNAHRHNNGILQCGTIIDYPMYQWRGLHLDESRHFFGMETVKQYLVQMAALKLNRFHWHLTDDQGWRIESKLFPRLCSVGAYRTEADGSRYGGFYTQEQIREIVAFASDRGITVVPEIDLPGHSMAILAAYPELACFEGTYSVVNSWGIFPDILCAGKPQTLDFLKALMEEMAELFATAYFHIGGDEAPKDNWKKCPHCQTKMSELGLRDEEELQGWLMREVAQTLQKRGKTVIGWDEILDGKIDKDILVMVWRGDGMDAAELAAKGGNSYILCPNRICYFDWKENSNSPGAHGISSLENVYGFTPSQYPRPDLCLGGQANLWTEYMHNPMEINTMLHPRMEAIAERLWNQSGAYPDFQARLQKLEGYLEPLS